MISDIAWENIHWLKKTFFDRLEQIGGSKIAVDSFRPYLKRDWINSLNLDSARQQIFLEIAEWAKQIEEFRLTESFKMKHWDESIQVAKGGEEYSRLIWFLFRSHYNIYCLATNRKTIEELALGAYDYNSKIEKHTEKFDKAALADLRRLLRLSNAFLLAEWVHDMIVRAIANEDKAFFRVLSNSVKENVFTDPSQSAVQWLLVILLWFLGGKKYERRRDFLHDLHLHGILPNSIVEPTFTAELRRFGVTKP